MQQVTDQGLGLARVQALDLLRLVAVLGVVLFHYGFRGPTAFNVTHVAIPELAWIGRYGFLGVPIFFVISGFVIAYSAVGRTATAFAIARFSRIYPCFLFCMTLTFSALLAFGPPHFEATFAQWAANLFIAATALRETYMDSAYWSLVVEVTFYGWVTILLAAKVFPRRIDAIVLTWLCLSMANELTADNQIVSRIFLTDFSGFLATGLLIHELYRGRRDLMLQCLLGLSVATALFQALHNLRWLRDRDNVFDDWVVATICLGSILLIITATRIRRLPIPASVVFAIGGVTYPFYLLHQQLGYTILELMGPVRYPRVSVVVILLAVAALSWLTWRFVERPGQRLTKQFFGDLFRQGRTRGEPRPINDLP
ncbi:MAG TPA: acyltransferase [Pseudolabrys sp.]|jgi:peptidoglycan/LPS O-acetylase OafA/YrhL|nr:acyltransferase [Pseudolabrys sp.]